MKYSISDGFGHVRMVDKTFGEFVLDIQSGTWTPALFKKDRRVNEDFLCTEMVALDFDDGLTVAEAMELFEPFAHIIGTTRNHLKEKNGVIKERFRVILLLDSPITNAADYRAVVESLLQQYPQADQACKDPARQFYPCVTIESSCGVGMKIKDRAKTGVSPDNNSLTHKETQSSSFKGRLARSTMDFLVDGAPRGQWNATLFKAAKDMQQNGYTEQEALERCQRITGILEPPSLKTIASAFRAPSPYDPRPHVQPLDPLEWLGSLLNQFQVDIKYNGFVYMGARNVNMQYLMDFIVLENARQGRKSQFSQVELKSALSTYLQENRDSILRRYMEAVSYTGLDTAFEELATFLTGGADPLVVAGLQHFVWQVKRKLHGLPTKWEMMPVLVGAGGAGKSFVAEKIIHPLRELHTQMHLNALSDERHYNVFQEYYIIFCDELGQADKAELASLKNIITSTSASYRILGQNQRANGVNRATFLGTSNVDVADVIRDTTGMRRFLQINCLPKLDHKKVEGFDYGRLWRAVDEQADSPIMSVKERLDHVQSEARPLTTVEEWLDHCTVISEGAKLRLNEAYDSYSEFMRKQNRRSQASVRQFSKELKNRGLYNRDASSIYYKLQLKGAYGGISLAQ